MSQPFISIIIPTYNRAPLISKTIDSFIAQTYDDWEMLIIDDYSLDNTKDVIDEYRLRDTRISYILNERKKGAQGARNTGILHAKADWVILFDSDNVAHPEMLLTLTKAIGPEIDVVSCFSNVFDINTHKQVAVFEWINEGDIHRNLFTWTSYVDFNQALIRKSKLIDIGMLDEDCPSMQEWDTHIRLSKIALYTTIHEHLVDYYVNGNDAISSDKKREVNGRLYVYAKHKNDWYCDYRAVDWMNEDVYKKIRLNGSYLFRISSLIKLVLISHRAIMLILTYRYKYLKRKLKK